MSPLTRFILGMVVNPDGLTPNTGIPVHLAEQMTTPEQHDWHREHLRRHAVSRRNFLAGSAAAAAAAGVGNAAWAGIAYAADAPLAIGGRHLSYGNDPATQITFSAQLSRNPGPTKVFLDHGLTPLLGATVEAQVRNLISQVPRADGGVLAAEQFYVHAAISELGPHTTHFYRWRTSDGATTALATARTAHRRGRHGSFRFTMMADQGIDDTPTQPPGLKPGDYDNQTTDPDDLPGIPHAKNVIAQVAKCKPDFHIVAGDISYADVAGRGTPLMFTPSGESTPDGFGRYNPYMWDGYFAEIEKSAASAPWFFASGNHDIESLYSPNGYGGHEIRLAQPTNGPTNCPLTYSVVYGNVAVLSLDANDVSHEVRALHGFSGGAQQSWLQRTLADLRADSRIDFIVAFYHECAYSTTKDHASDGGVRSAWSPLFDQYQVDVVFQGHNHVYERSDPIRNGKPRKAAPDRSTVRPQTDGTVYYTVGGGGNSRYAFPDGVQESYRGNTLTDTSVPNSYVWTSDGEKQPEAVEWSRVRHRAYSFVRIDVKPGIPGIIPSRMIVVGVDEYGREFDEVTFERSIPLIGGGGFGSS